MEPELANTDTALAESLGEQPVRHPARVLCPQHDGQGAVRPGRALAHAAAHLRGRDDAPNGPGRGRGLGSYYACFDGSDDVYTVSSSDVAFLDAATLQNLVNEFANIVAISGVEQLTVDLDGAQATFVIDRSGEEDVVLRDGQSVDAEAFKAAFQAINVVPVNGFTSAEEVAEAPRS